MVASLSLVLCLLGAAPATSQRNPVFSGIVDKVLDGDTIRVRIGGRFERVISLWGVDAPETSQPFGPEATQYLTKLALHRQVVVEDYGKLGDVYVNLPDRQVLANERMVVAGYAWVHVPKEIENYGVASIADQYRKAEQSARSAKRGLWSRPEPIAPWCWPGERAPG